MYVCDGLTFMRLPAHGHGKLFFGGDLGCPLIMSLDKLGLPLPNLVAYAPNFSAKHLNRLFHARSYLNGYRGNESDERFKEVVCQTIYVIQGD